MSYLFTKAFVTIDYVDALTLRNNNKLAEKRRKKNYRAGLDWSFCSLALAGSTLSLLPSSPQAEI